MVGHPPAMTPKILPHITFRTGEEMVPKAHPDIDLFTSPAAETESNANVSEERWSAPGGSDTTSVTVSDSEADNDDAKNRVVQAETARPPSQEDEEEDSDPGLFNTVMGGDGVKVDKVLDGRSEEDVLRRDQTTAAQAQPEKGVDFKNLIKKSGELILKRNSRLRMDMHDALVLKPCSSSDTCSIDHFPNPRGCRTPLPHKSSFLEKSTTSLPSRSAVGDHETARFTKGRSISFSGVTIREYPMTVGDHPNCSYGPPVQLSWEYDEYEQVDFDDYETRRPPRRDMQGMLMNYHHRKNMLMHWGGHSKEDLKAATKEVKKVKMQRKMTVVLMPVNRVTEMALGAKKKLTKAIKKGATDSVVHELSSGQGGSLAT